MKMISKNAETIVLLCIIFYIFFSLVVLNETKINTLEFDIQKYNDDIEETNQNIEKMQDEQELPKKKRRKQNYTIEELVELYKIIELKENELKNRVFI